ncbi:hypothetical protein FSARC_13162 [Fusarium sarcochroum]|uniref:Homeobox domain-containing protein n=1 Tax=Fusarium sarcochroum TaxID=1208366 RepID=A0A8H4WUR3_9HYPO|nr:hypothetical protein FSARC_13162 [Fusarium sarcochroum]
MTDAPDTSHRAEADPSLSETLGAELASSILDIDALTFDSSEFHSSGYVSVSPQDSFEQNDFFNVNFDELWSANLAQIPPGADTTDFNQSQPVDLSHHQDPHLPQDISASQEGLIQHGHDFSNQEFDDLLDNVFEFPTSNRPSAHTPDAGIPSLPSPLPPKIGNRFTLDSLRALKEWFAKHSKNPYPTEEEKTMLERQTGLNRTQVTNWLANARRRRTTTDSGTQTAASRTTKSPSDATYTPRRAGTPIPRSRHSPRNMDPLQRWVDSPPENEPAAVSAIARAMASGDIVSSSEFQATTMP